MIITKFINSKYKRFYLNEIIDMELTPESRFQLIVGRNGCGKAQPLYSKIKTPTGWITMGDVKLGDVVSTPDGKTAPVVGIFPQSGLRPVYEVELADGRKTHADIEHLWKVNKTYKGSNLDLKDGWCIMTTRDIIKYYNERSLSELQLPIFDTEHKVENTGTNQYSYNSVSAIKSVTYVGLLQTQCIMIYHPDHLYITDDFIVTHNTSLLRAIFDQPADKKDYDKGGYNEVHCTHNQKEYILINDFTKGAKYSFKIRDQESDSEYEELNESRLITTQRELYYTHFGLNSEIVDLLVGDTVFTQMPINKRREWFDRMHTNDMSYLNAKLKDLKTQLRDASGTIKMLGEKLLIEKSNQLTQSEYESLAKERELAYEINHKLASSFNQSIIDSYDSSQMGNLKVQLEQANSQAKAFFDCKGNYDTSYIEATVSRTREVLEAVRNERDKYKALLSDTIKRYDQLVVNKSEYSAGSSMEELVDDKAKYIAIISEIDEYLTSQHGVVSKYDYTLPIISDDEIDTVRRDMMYAVPSTDDVDAYKGIIYDDVYDLCNKKHNELDFANHKLSGLIAKVKHMDEHKGNDQVDCPECKHRFNPAYNVVEHERLSNLLVERTKYVENLEKEVKELDKLVEELRVYQSRFDELKPFIGKYNLKELFTDIISLRTHSERTLLIDKYFKVMSSTIKLKKAQSALQSILETIKVKEEKGDNYGKLLDKDLVETDKLLSTYQSKYTDYEARYLLVQKAYDRQVKSDKLVNEIIPNTISKINQSFIESIHYQENALIKRRWEESLRHIQLIDKQYSDYQMKSNLIKNYEELLNETESKKASLVILVKEVSDIIDEQSTLFINVFIDAMNNIIKRIFNYDLTVEPCDLAEGDLTYRFRVTGSGQDRPDVSNTSDGQAEVINWAYKLLAYHYCHLSNIPFINDELGRAFDDHHKQVSIDYLNELLKNDIFGQFFLISHHASSYTSLIDSDVIVLDPNNVVLPEVYNTTLKINHLK